MAHVAKIKQGAVAPMVAHYERKPELERGYERDNIDPERTADNYNLRPSDVRQEVGLAIAEHEQTAGKGIRKDANVLLDWVVTMPKDCPREMHREFFESVAEFVEGRYGKGNVLGCYVHMDEATPHAHIPILPMKDGKLVASKVVNRADLRTFHGDLGKAVDAALGMHVSIELDEQQKGEKQLSALSQSEYVAAKQRLECLQREEGRAVEEVREMEPAAQTVAESAGALLAARSDREREKGLASEIEGLRRRISALESEKAGIEGEIRGLERAVPELERRAGGLERGVELARTKVAALAEQVRGYVANVGERAARMLSRFGVEAYAEQPPLEAQMRQAREAARAMSASRGYVPRDRWISR